MTGNQKGQKGQGTHTDHQKSKMEKENDKSSNYSKGEKMGNVDDEDVEENGKDDSSRSGQRRPSHGKNL